MASPMLSSLVGPRCAISLAGLAMLLATAGCGQQNSKLPTANVPSQGDDLPGETGKAVEQTPTADTTAAAKPDAAELLKKLIATYAGAKTYQDAGEVQITVEDDQGQKQSSPVMPFSVAFERPNKIRVHSLEASVVSDGKELRASANSLAGQVLLVDSPATLTMDSLEADELLVQAMRGQIDLALPQLALLLAANPIEMIAGEGPPVSLGDEEYDGHPCHRVAVQGRRGTSVFWISPASGLLVKYEFPAEAFQQKYGLAGASITAEFKGAKVDEPISADAFKFDVPEDAKLLSRFLPPPPPPPSPLLGQKPAEFTLVDFAGGTVDQASLEGKVVVLDIWATWCGWCFEGFPNLQKVYDQFKDNDKVVILAVNTDELSVTDEKVKESFEKAGLTIPIARDQQQAADRVFKVEGLPTMLVLGPDGTVEDYHIGYDARLAETLPPKLNKLLAGESLAKEELEAYKKKLDEYGAQEAAALVDGGKPQSDAPSKE